MSLFENFESGPITRQKAMQLGRNGHFVSSRLELLQASKPSWNQYL
jgi:hypothetical protein